MTLQIFLVLVIVGAAAVYVVRRLVRSARGHSEGACMKCDSGDKKKG